MGAIFVCYRRSDEPLAGRIHDQLEARFGGDRVFRDIEHLEPGEKFRAVIREKINRCDVLIAIIGPQWLTASNHAGTRRLDDPDDYVKAEIKEALAQGKSVIPVLAHNVAMPRRDELPDELMELAEINALRLSEDHFRTDVSELIATLEKITSRSTERSLLFNSRRRVLALGAAGIILVSGALLAWVLSTPRNLIVNGSFEDPAIPSQQYRLTRNIPGWQVDSKAEAEIQHNFAGEGESADGQQHIELDGKENGSISQTVSTEPGRHYVLKFAYSPRPGQPEDTNRIEVLFNGEIIATVSSVGETTTAWKRYKYDVVAKTRSTVLTFRAAGKSDGWGGLLDAVSLEAN